MKTNLVNCVKKNDYKGFISGLTADNLRLLLTDQEEHILLLAPNKWLVEFIKARRPSDNGQQVIISHRSREIVKLVHDAWELSPAVVEQVMSSGTPMERGKVIFALEAGAAVAS